MKKILFGLFITLFLFCCSSFKETQVEEKVITGKIEKATLSTTEFPWFDRNYKNYSIPVGFKKELSDLLSDKISCKIFMGTWCSDSRRDVPKFIKIADSIGFVGYEIIGVDHNKVSTLGIEKDFHIEKVPTFIFIKAGKETGRIIENPVKSIHEDIIDILKKAD
jgi:thiol-disulfide isomerase/thioredoxin